LAAESSRRQQRNKAQRAGKRWIRLRKYSQILALFGFLAVFLLTRTAGEQPGLLALPFRLDPLVMLAQLLSSKVWLVSSSLALVTVLLTLIFGRAWCGWLCPLGTILDWFSLKRWRVKDIKVGENWRAVKYSLLVVILVAALLGNLTLLILDPLTLVYRTLTVSVLPLLDQLVSTAESTLYKVPFLAGPISTFDTWVRPGILPVTAVEYQQTWVFLGVFVVVIALNAVAPRFWCRYLCPLGGLLGLISKAALVRREVREDCKGCGLCTSDCPTGTIDPTKGYASDPGECTMCLDCLESCPRSSVVFTAGRPVVDWQDYDPDRRKVLISMGAGFAAFALLRIERIAGSQRLYMLQPPGGTLNQLTSKCIRCGMCMRACPTGALQPALLESGLEGLWSPVLIPRLGYCDYACNACGQICPVQAIPPLSLEDKRVQVIGKATIDQDRCIAWAEKTDCIVCEEMCPLPEKAIQLEPSELSRADGTPVTVQLPEVLEERCIGCGICEYKCPVEGEAAIRVTAIEGEIVY